jgi:2-keto-3-deoxy-L-rhamnonate aldolase RhmA
MVVIGRWDLANSMGTQDVDDKHVGAVTAEIVDRVRAKGKSVSIGGFVNPSTAASIQQTYRAHHGSSGTVAESMLKPMLLAHL